MKDVQKCRIFYPTFLDDLLLPQTADERLEDNIRCQVLTDHSIDHFYINEFVPGILQKRTSL